MLLLLFSYPVWILLTNLSTCNCVMFLLQLPSFMIKARISMYMLSPSFFTILSQKSWQTLTIFGWLMVQPGSWCPMEWHFLSHCAITESSLWLLTWRTDHDKYANFLTWAFSKLWYWHVYVRFEAWHHSTSVDSKVVIKEKFVELEIWSMNYGIKVIIMLYHQNYCTLLGWRKFWTTAMCFCKLM